MTRVIGSFAIKGGVGKTATVVNLAYLAASEGAHTLIWDLDPQGAVSFYYRVEPQRRGGIRRMLTRAGRLHEAIRSTDYANLDLIPAGDGNRKMERVMHEASKPLRVMASRLREVDRHYDFVFLDCPPGLSLLSQSVLQGLDALIVPIVPTTLSLRTWQQLTEYLAKQGPQDLKVLPFYSMCDRRKRLHCQIMDEPLEGPTHPLDHSIPYAVEVERMGQKREPVDRFASTSDAAVAYRGLWEDIKARLSTGG